MLKLLSLGLALGVATGAVAQTRPYLPAMSCNAAAGLVAHEGAVVAGTGPNTYERIVVNGGFCPVEQTTAPAWEHTADVPLCFVGYRCKEKFNEGSDANR